jgi:hypothetical protein
MESLDMEEQIYFEENFHRHIDPICVILDLVQATDRSDHLHPTGRSRHFDIVYIGYGRDHKEIELNLIVMELIRSPWICRL